MLSEQLTANFYAWEIRGRGWQVWDYPVEIEPPFEPFFHCIPLQPVVDDGRKPTFFSSLIEKFHKSQSAEIEKREQLLYDLPEQLMPLPFEDFSDLNEIGISLPVKQKVQIENTEQFLLNLSYCSAPLSFEVIGSGRSIGVQLACRNPDALQVKQQLRAYFPEAVLNEESDLLKSLWRPEKETLIIDFGLSQEFMRPLRGFEEFHTDPLVGIVGALENLQEDEVGLLQVLFQVTRQPWAESIMRSVTDLEGHSFFADSPEMVQLAKEKTKNPFFGVVVRVASQSREVHRAWEIGRDLASGLTLLAQPQSNELIPLENEGYDDLSHREDVILRRTRRSPMLWNSQELVSLVHLPSISVRSEKLRRELKKTKGAPGLAIGHRYVLGENLHQGKRSIVSLSPEQRLRHLYIVGATGTGKSTLLFNLILQDIEQGHGLAVLDPHGDLIDGLLAHVSDNRFDDVLLLDPSDAEYPVGLNILSAHSEVEKNVLASDLVSVFRRLSTSWGDQMTSVLGNAILAFLESEEGGTLVDLRRFLVEPQYRKEFLKTVKDQEVVYYWEKEFPLLSGKPQAPILTRLDSFLRPKLIRHMVAQKEGVNFDEIINTRKILFAKLAQGLIGEENAYLLGTFIVSKLHQAAMARQAKAASERENFYLYIDEFQNFITPSMAAILSGARKYRLGLILAHQELRQLWNRDTEVANSVISNPGTRICFRLGDFDAQKLREGFSYFEAEDLQNLGIAEAIVRVERRECDFNLKALPPREVSPELAGERRESLTNLSRKKYGTPGEEIERRLVKEKAWVPLVSPQEQIKEARIHERKEPEIPLQKKKVKKEEKTEIETATPPAPAERGLSQHRYLQSLIKRMAESRGFRTIIEEVTPDGLGRVDVGLERDGRKIACEICVTTTDEQELGNIEKCLAAGYEKVILCSPEKKTLERVKGFISSKLKESDLEKVLFFQPEELFFHLEKEAAAWAGKEERIKGYRVKVQYQPVAEGEKKSKREAVGQVILQALKRMKEGK